MVTCFCILSYCSPVSMLRSPTDLMVIGTSYYHNILGSVNHSITTIIFLVHSITTIIILGSFYYHNIIYLTDYLIRYDNPKQKSSCYGKAREDCSSLSLLVFVASHANPLFVFVVR